MGDIDNCGSFQTTVYNFEIISGTRWMLWPIKRPRCQVVWGLILITMNLSGRHWHKTGDQGEDFEPLSVELRTKVNRRLCGFLSDWSTPSVLQSSLHLSKDNLDTIDNIHSINTLNLRSASQTIWDQTKAYEIWCIPHDSLKVLSQLSPSDNVHYCRQLVTCCADRWWCNSPSAPLEAATNMHLLPFHCHCLCVCLCAYQRLWCIISYSSSWYKARCPWVALGNGK